MTNKMRITDKLMTKPMMISGHIGMVKEWSNSEMTGLIPIMVFHSKIRATPPNMINADWYKMKNMTMMDAPFDTKIP